MIRPAVPADEGAITRCARTAYAQYVTVIGQKPAPMLADYALKIAAGHVYVAVDGHDAVEGFVVFYQQEDHLHLENIAVFSHLAGQGIGKALIAYCEAQARALGLGSVQLYTNEKMTNNAIMYKRLGYSETERRKEDGFSRIYFAKRLG